MGGLSELKKSKGEGARRAVLTEQLHHLGLKVTVKALALTGIDGGEKSLECVLLCN